MRRRRNSKDDRKHLHADTVREASMIIGIAWHMKSVATPTRSGKFFTNTNVVITKKHANWCF